MYILVIKVAKIKFFQKCCPDSSVNGGSDFLVEWLYIFFQAWSII